MCTVVRVETVKGRRRRINICEILSVELFLEQKIFLPVLLFDGGQGVDVVLELAHGVLLLLGGSQPPLVTLDQF